MTREQAIQAAKDYPVQFQALLDAVQNWLDRPVAGDDYSALSEGAEYEAVKKALADYEKVTGPLGLLSGVEPLPVIIVDDPVFSEPPVSETYFRLWYDKRMTARLNRNAP